MNTAKRLLAASLTVITLSAGIATPSMAAAPTKPCIDTKKLGTKVPVILVHGWNSNGGSWGKDSDTKSMVHAINNVSGVYLDTPFDYSKQNQSWVDNNAIGPKLAERIACVAAASREAKGAGRVVVVGHSMGGLATRFAANRKVNDRAVADDLGLVITIGTPHLGSAWGNVIDDVLTPLCWGVDKVSHIGDNNPCALTAMKGLSMGSDRLAKLPRIPKKVPVFQLAGDVSLTTPIFNVTVVPSFSDLIVGTASAQDYGPHKEFSSTRGPNTSDCGIAMSALNNVIAMAAFNKLPSCWHSGLIRDKQTQQRVTGAISRYVGNLTASFVGEWRVHGREFIVRGNGTIAMEDNAGPCPMEGTSAERWCYHVYKMSYTRDGTSLLVKITNVEYVAYDPPLYGDERRPAYGYEPAAGDRIEKGDTFRLVRVTNHTLEMVWDKTHLSRESLKHGNHTLCDKYAQDRNDQEEFHVCGA
jgi:hypothetical protein